MSNLNSLKYTAAVFGAGLLALGFATAGDKGLVLDDSLLAAAPGLNDFALCDTFEKGCVVFDNDNTQFIKKVKMVMRYHGQFHDTSLTHSSGTTWSEEYWEHRRLRPGIKVDFANGWKFYNEWGVGGTPKQASVANSGDFFDAVYNMGIKGEIGAFTVDIGKHKAKMSREWETSSNRIITAERSHIVNEIIAFSGHPWGVTVGFETPGIEHEFGAWLSGSDDFEDGSDDEHWWNGNSNGALSYRIGHELNKNSSVHFDYMFVNNSGGRVDPVGNGSQLEVSPYNHTMVLSSANEWEVGNKGKKFGLLAEAIGASGREARSGMNIFGNNDRMAGDDTFGFLIIPSYDLTEQLQLVGRYAYASSSRMQRPQRRAFERDGERVNQTGNGEFDDRPNLEDVHTFYLGLNYRICGDHLKLVAGYEYLTADLYDNPASATDNGSIEGGNWMFSIRSYF